jgi:signal transduction histidine kinase
MRQRTTTDRRHLHSLAQIGKNVGVLLHQARSPVVTIGLLARSIKRHASLSGASATRLDQIIEYTMELEDLLNVSLGFLKPSRAGSEAVNVANLVSWAAERCAPKASDADVRVEVDVGKAPRSVPGHRDSLRHALLNIVDNAVEACRKGRGTVIVRARGARKGLVIAVQDTGVGMTEDEAKKALEPFFTTRQHGTGLGLAFANKVVRDHGGRIQIKTERRKGTTVTVRLPDMETRLAHLERRGKPPATVRPRQPEKENPQ